MAEAARHQQHTCGSGSSNLDPRPFFDTVPQHGQMTHVGSVPGDRIQVPLGVALEAALVAVARPAEGLVVLFVNSSKGFDQPR